jgi:hypothetical protein
VHFVVDDVAGGAEVDRVDDLVVAVVLVTSQCIARSMFAFVGWLMGFCWSSVRVTMSSRL